jgi:small subunit ribosomal protein S1
MTLDKTRQDDEDINDLELPEELESISIEKEPEIIQHDIAEEEEVKLPLEEVIKVNASPAVNEFDWDAYAGGKNVYTKNDLSKLEKMYEDTFSELKEKEVIHGTVVGITDKDVVLNIGFKSDGLVPLSEFKYLPDLKVGDKVEVIVENKEDKNGQIVISHKKALAESAWDKIMDAHEKDMIVKGYIKDRTKGGMVVDLMGMDAFLPGSQLDVKPIKDYDSYVGTWMDLKVVKVNEQYRNIVVSHKAIIESGLELQKTEILSKLEKGQVLEGIVKNLTSFGVFVDLGGVDGLIHITDVSWGRINHPEEVLELGQKINVVVLDYDEDKRRISLGMKQLTPHPWETLPEDIQEGSVVKGKVVNMEDYGAFIEIFPGVEGLVHVSEMSWSTHLKSPHEYIKLGDEVEAKVLSIDREERKLSLGLKQLTTDPWADIEQRYAPGTKHTATVRSMTNFGLFVELEPGIDGLVHISDLSWTRKFSHPAEFTKVGEKIDVVVLDLDKENRRLSLGHKQLEEDPWDTFSSIFFEGSIHQGVLHHIDDKGATVGLPYGVEAYVPKKFLAKADKSQPKVDETLEFKVKEFDKSNRKIILSHSDVWRDEERSRQVKEEQSKIAEEDKTKKDIKKVKSSVEKSSMGDELDILQQLKNQMEEQDKVKQKEAMEEMEKKSKSKKAADETETESPVAGTEEAVAETPAEPKKKSSKAKAETEEQPDLFADETAEPKKKAAKAKSETSVDETEEATAEEPKKKASRAKATETAAGEPEAEDTAEAPKKKAAKAKAEGAEEQPAEEEAPKKKAATKKKAADSEEEEEE